MSCDAQQDEGDHGCDELKANGVFGAAEKGADLQMLLDPSEQQLDLPTCLVEGGDFRSRALEIVGDEGEHPALVALDAQATERDGELGITLAGKADFVVAEDNVSVALRLMELSA